MAGPDDQRQTKQTSLDGGDAAERQRRLDALRSLAEHATQAAAGAPSKPATPRPSLAPPSRRRPTQRTRNRWLAAIAATLCVVVIAVVAITRLAQPRAHVSTNRPTGPTVIHLTRDHIGCPQDVAWSPAGDKLAVFGANCGASDTLLNIYDASSGKLTAQTNLTTLTRQALQSYTPDSSAYLPVFLPALWTQQDLFIPFRAVDPNATDSAGAIHDEGLLGFNVDSAAPPQPGFGIVPNHSGPDAYVGWDSNGFTSSYTATHPAALIGPAPSNTVFSSLPPALGYDVRSFPPRPLTLLSYGASPPRDPGGPIGDPRGDSLLTIWQPGTLTYYPTIPGTSTPASMVLFDTSFAALARPILYTGLAFEGRLVPPDQPAPDVNALDAAGLLAPWLPIRDAALAYVVTDVEHSAAPGVGPAAIAWRPDGTRLAYQPGIAINGGGGNPRAHDVRIYDCQSGQVLATLTPPLSAGTPIRATNLLRWSPDGEKLLLLDAVAGEIVVWGHGQLPA